MSEEQLGEDFLGFFKDTSGKCEAKRALPEGGAESDSGAAAVKRARTSSPQNSAHSSTASTRKQLSDKERKFLVRATDLLRYSQPYAQQLPETLEYLEGVQSYLLRKQAGNASPWAGHSNKSMKQGLARCFHDLEAVVKK